MHQTTSPEDRLGEIISQLGRAPEYTTEELSRARQGTIALEISARYDRGGQFRWLAMAKVFALRAPADPQAQERAQAEELWVSTKRLVLSVLKVQPGEDLLDALEAPVTEEHEALWYQIRVNDTQEALRQQQAGRMAPAYFHDVQR